MKALARLVLLLCVLVTGTYGYMYAHTDNRSAKVTIRPALPAGGEHGFSFRYAETGEEDSEDEFISLKKNQGHSPYLPGSYSLQLAGFLYHQFTHRSSQHQYFSFAAPRYILYRVIRI